MPLAALKHYHTFFILLSTVRCNSPNAACGIETSGVQFCLRGVDRCNSLNAACGIEFALPFWQGLFFCQQCRILCLNAVLFYGGILNVILQKKIRTYMPIPVQGAGFNQCKGMYEV